MNRNLGLYLHIPFCVRKCNYCDFFSMAATESALSQYTDKLCNNVVSWSEVYKDRVVDSVYFGGGTPSVMGTDRIARILEVVSNSFTLSDDCEITIEVNPSSSDVLDFGVLKKYGVNRVSMGLQSSDNNELALLGRLHKTSDVQFTIDKLKQADISNFSLDVMLGIPMQTMDSLSDTLDFCIDAGAVHISTYMLKIEKNTPFYTRRDEFVFADEDLQCDMYEFTCKKLSENGFRHYEISNFCKDNKLSRHNMKYWKLEDYLGLGPSAHSMTDGKRFYYPRSFSQFYSNEIIEDGVVNFPSEYLMLSLRTDLGFDFDKYKKLSNSPIPFAMQKEFERLEKLGFLHINNKCAVLTEKGYLLSNNIIASLLSKESE